MSTRQTHNRSHRLLLTAAATCVLAGLTGCGASPGAGQTPASAAESSPTSTPPSAPSSAVTESEDPATVATEAIELFGRPDEPERRWFAELRPYLEEEYAVEAEYIDPARIPFSEVQSSPELNRDSHNPQLTTVDYKTDDGIWTVTLHQDSPGGKWLVGGIAPATG